MTNNTLINYRNSITSQWGEDGIIEEIFNRIGTENMISVEFGAWDGEHLSNTWNLWHNKGWSSVLIEGNKLFFDSLKKKYINHKNLHLINEYVTCEGKNSLDSLLTKLKLTYNFDLLSIDIDGDDYYIFESLEIFKPRVIIVEHNPTAPPEFEIIQNPGSSFGASALALVNLAKKKGYKLACCTETNCFFVREEEFEKLDLNNPSLNDLFVRDHLTYLLTDQKGIPYLSRLPTYVSKIERFSIVKYLKHKIRKNKKNNNDLSNSGLQLVKLIKP
jgi:hypothetical protein